MMLFLASLIAFHVFVVLFLVIVPCQLLSVLSYFGNIGFASLVCLQRLLVTGMQDLRVGFGRSCLDCWSVGLHLVQLITLRLMGLQNDFTVVLSRFYDAIVLVLRISGVFY
jgi:hypothetical protein